MELKFSIAMNTAWYQVKSGVNSSYSDLMNAAKL
jgi:hypothetical protein